MGIEQPVEVVEKLGAYVSLLSKWNKAYNLTAIRNLEDMVSRHILDSLSLVTTLSKNPAVNIIDVGTGPGLPGIPLSIVFPERQFTLLDSNSKKTRFLNQCKIELDLGNINIVYQRAEKYIPARLFDIVISRAFSSLDNMVRWCDHLLDKKGVFFAMKGQYPEQEIKQIANRYQIDSSLEVFVPECDGKRHLLILSRIAE
ncbi:MAG: 16S rRNA (guanine(527)-N(7))-methyltransferase RsmG [Gammaproteobacteria bacterium]|nr:MAG: 16S rRNA (guanine(527)-N(7))-methyltransferase RsmG [Pseudomonadota bacterium]PIE38280.1 MAG: 16S rRNA (guanine(527)-N(7))-methyltransferase RsmG [Gammaproteobacteria bacterium]